VVWLVSSARRVRCCRVRSAVVPQGIRGLTYGMTIAAAGTVYEIHGDDRLLSPALSHPEQLKQKQAHRPRGGAWAVALQLWPRARDQLSERCSDADAGPAGELTMQTLWQTFWSDETGQGLVEYALIIALVAVGLIAILLVLRNSIGNVFNNAATVLNNAPTNPYP
jgi:pilus assembly protein Flp/PilA